MENIKIEQHTSWLFTIGFLHLRFWQGVIAIVIWPYYLGVRLSPLLLH